METEWFLDQQSIARMHPTVSADASKLTYHAHFDCKTVGKFALILTGRIPQHQIF